MDAAGIRSGAARGLRAFAHDGSGGGV